MPVRAILNFVYVYNKPGRDGTAEENEKYDDELYAPFEVRDWIGG